MANLFLCLSESSQVALLVLPMKDPRKRWHDAAEKLRAMKEAPRRF